MKKNIPFWAKCLLVVALLAAAYFWYTRPMTLDRLCPSFRWAETTHVGGYEQVGNISAPSPIISSTALPIDDPEARAIYQRCLEARFRRDPGTALANFLSGWSTYTFGEAGGIPNLAFFAPDQRIDLMVTEYKTAALSSADIDMPLLCTDETLVQDLLDYLRAHPYEAASDRSFL